MTDDQFNQLFKKLDPDGDGKISYSEFLTQANKALQNDPKPYFRQDLTHRQLNSQMKACAYQFCSKKPAMLSDYCILHAKLLSEQANICL